MSLGIRSMVPNILHNAQVVTTDDASAELDMQDYINVGGREVCAFLAINLSSDTTTDATVDYVMQESATTVSSDFATIAGASFDQILTTDLSNAQNQRIYFQVTKRYVRGLSTVEGTTKEIGVVSGVLAILRATT